MEVTESASSELKVVHLGATGVRALPKMETDSDSSRAKLQGKLDVCSGISNCTSHV